MAHDALNTSHFPERAERAGAMMSMATDAQVLRTRSGNGLDAIQWRGPDKGIFTAPATRELLAQPIIEALPIRVGGQWQNRPNRHGLYFWVRTGRHLWYESALELACLLGLDFDGSVQAIASQPFRMLFRAGAKSVRHDPDFFAVHRNGDQVVYDVKPRARMTSRASDQFDESSRVCKLVGWRHAVLHELDPVVAGNLDFLRGVRHARNHPGEAVFGQILNVFEGGRAIGEGREMVNRRFPALAMPSIRHLIWHRFLKVDLTRRLDFDSIATTDVDAIRSFEVASCCV